MEHTVYSLQFENQGELEVVASLEFLQVAYIEFLEGIHNSVYEILY